MPGDFKPDSNVVMYDVCVLALAWNSRPDDSNWDSDCDLYVTAEPVIDMRDLSVFVAYWLDYFEKYFIRNLIRHIRAVNCTLVDICKPIIGTGSNKTTHLNVDGDVFVDYNGDLL